MEKHEGGLTDAEKVADDFSTVSDSGRDADLSGRGLVRKLSLGTPSDDLSPHLTTSGVNTVFGLVPVDLIDSRFYPENDNGITRQVEDGSVIYWVDKDRTSKVGSSNIQTILKPPEGTVNVKCTDESGQVYMNQSPWFDYTSGDSTPDPEYPAQAGRTYLGRHCQHLRDLPISGSKRKVLEGQRPVDNLPFLYRRRQGLSGSFERQGLAVHSAPIALPVLPILAVARWVITYQNGLAHIQAMQTGNVSEVAAHRVLPGALKHYAVAAYPGAASYQLPDLSGFLECVR